MDGQTDRQTDKHLWRDRFILKDARKTGQTTGQFRPEEGRLAAIGP